jgi:putative transposase
VVKNLKYNQEIHNRRSIRLKGYDYSREGMYFITICTHDRMCLFGKVENEEMNLNEYGKIAEKCFLAIPEHHPYAKLGPYIVMPNHIHCIIEITVGANNYSPLQTQTKRPIHGTSKTIGSIVRGFKIGVTKWFRKNTDIHTVWQRNYYDHIIRNEKSYCRIADYIINNPLKWQDDKYYA